MPKIKSICVYCGANTGNEPDFIEAAQELGAFLANNYIRLVYGAGNVGLMGVIADATLEAGGEVIGVIPHFLKEKEVWHRNLTELILTDDMHTRKAEMERLSDAFIAMPGGFGTLDELAEILSWAQLGLHKKPVGLLNVNGYYGPLISFFDQMVEKGLLRTENRKILQYSATPSDLLSKFQGYQPPDVEKWLNSQLV